MQPASTPQLAAYLRLRAEGCSIATAADESGLPVDEAWEAEAAVQRGELKFTRGENDMAVKAVSESEEQTSVELAKPDYERAIRVLNHDVKPSEEKNAESRGNLSAAWKIIEDECHVVKSAAKTFHKLATMSAEKRDDWLRSFYGLCETGNVGISRDLVDRMGTDEATTMPITEPSAREGLATLEIVQ